VATDLLRSVARLLNLDIGIPDHTTLSRRSAAGALATDLATVTGLVHVVIDSTGLKVYGAGEWHREKHGGRDRRTWRKLHLAMDPDTGEILACELTDQDQGDPSQVGALLDQVTGAIASVTAPTTATQCTRLSPSGRPKPTSSSRRAPRPSLARKLTRRPGSATATSRPLRNAGVLAGSGQPAMVADLWVRPRCFAIRL
jgi:hypothetical protein